ncbi:MAG: hypothetical protein HRT99_00325 [Mycoplasmatales bacterium]|nr:hypothetical protein [Mycoplasmatales bacterium]
MSLLAITSIVINIPDKNSERNIKSIEIAWAYCSLLEIDTRKNPNDIERIILRKLQYKNANKPLTVAMEENIEGTLCNINAHKISHKIDIHISIVK